VSFNDTIEAMHSVNPFAMNPEVQYGFEMILSHLLKIWFLKLNLKL
jgi:hypothetical protein